MTTAHGKITVTTTKGKRKFTTGGLLEKTAQIALSQNIKAQLLKSGITDELAQKEAKKKRQEVAAISRAYYLAMLKGSMSLVSASNIAAQWDKLPHVANSKHPAYRRKDKIKLRGKGPSSGFHPKILQTQALLSDANTPSGLPTSVTISTSSVYWKRLTERYALRSPKSKMFFRKNTIIKKPDRSARFAFVKEINTIQNSAKVRSISAYYKGTVAVSALQKDGSRTAEFKISYPPLESKLDFLRKSFISGMKNISVAGDNDTSSLGSTGVDALLRAEHYRPLTRPYASAVGRQMKTLFDKLGKQRDMQG